MNDYIRILEQTNYWSGRSISNGLVRDKYVAHINGYIGNKLIKFLVGQRGVGKELLLRKIAEKLINDGTSPKNIIIIDKLFTDSKVFLSMLDLQFIIDAYKELIRPVGRVYIFIAEIQNIVDWQTGIYKMNHDNNHSYEFFLSSSVKFDFSSNDPVIAKSIISFDILPPDYNEFLFINAKENIRSSYFEYLNQGCKVTNQLTLINNYNAGAALVNTILFKDIVQQYKVKEPVMLEMVFVYLCQHISQLITVNSIVSYFNSRNYKISYETVAAYLYYLESVSLIYRIERLQIKDKKVKLGSCRYYINLCMLTQLLYPFFQYDDTVKLQNQIFLELCHKKYHVNVGIHKTKMIDFVAKKNDRIIYLQCVSSIQDQGVLNHLYHSLAAIKDNYEKWIITLDDYQLPSIEGVRHIQAWELHQYL